MANETYGNQVFLGELEVIGKLSTKKSLAIGSGDSVSVITSDNGELKIQTPLSELLYKNGVWTIGGNEILTTAISITPDSIGAISTSGGIIKGSLFATEFGSDIIKSRIAEIDKLHIGSINDLITISDGVVDISALVVNGSSVYTTANKPTPEDIGAISSSTPVVVNLTSTGQIDAGYLSITTSIKNPTTAQNGLYLYYSNDGADFIHNSADNTGFRFFNVLNNKKTKVMELSGDGVLNVGTVLENGDRVYSPNNPPPIPDHFVALDGSTTMTGALVTPVVDSPIIALGTINRIYSTDKPSCTNTNTDLTIRSSHGIGFLNPNASCVVPKNENAFLFDVKNAIGISRGSWVSPVINSTDKYMLSGKVVFEKSTDGWLSVNPNMDYHNGLYFHDSILYTNSGLYIGDNGSAIKATADGVLRTKTRISTAQVKLDPQPSSSWGIDNKSAITIDDNNSVQWLLSTAINDVISAGIQCSKDTIRLYTNTKKSFTEFTNGNVYISGTQDTENKNSLVSLAYFESIIKTVPVVVDGVIKYNSTGFVHLGSDVVRLGLPGSTLDVTPTGPEYKSNKILHTGNTNVLIWKGINQTGFVMNDVPHGIYTVYYTHIENNELDFSDVFVWDGTDKNGVSGNKSYTKNSVLKWDPDFVLTEIRRFL